MRSALRSSALLEAWFDTLGTEHQTLARRLRDLVMAAEPSLDAGIKWGNLLFTWQRTHAVAIVMHKSHANLQIFNGAQLVDRFPQLEGHARGSRLLKLSVRDAPDAELVTALVHACVALLDAERIDGQGRAPFVEPKVH